MVGAVLISGDNLVLSQFCGFLEDFLESGLWTFAACLEEKLEKSVSEKINENLFLPTGNRFQVFIYILNKIFEIFEFPVVGKY